MQLLKAFVMLETELWLQTTGLVILGGKQPQLGSKSCKVEIDGGGVWKRHADQMTTTGVGNGIEHEPGSMAVEPEWRLDRQVESIHPVKIEVECYSRASKERKREVTSVKGVQICSIKMAQNCEDILLVTVLTNAMSEPQNKVVLSGELRWLFQICTNRRSCRGLQLLKRHADQMTTTGVGNGIEVAWQLNQSGVPEVIPDSSDTEPGDMPGKLTSVNSTSPLAPHQHRNHLDNGQLSPASSKQAHHHTSRHYSTIWCTRSEPPIGAGSQAVVESTLPRPGHVLHQWPRDLHELTPLYNQLAHTTLRPASSHHSTTSELTPLYDQRAHTTLRPASSHPSMTSELTPLYDQRAHTILRLASSHHSTTMKLTPLYDQRAHTTLRPEYTPLYDQLAHTILRPANSHHSKNSKLTPLYEQRAHTTLQTASSHHSTTSELTPLYEQRAHTTLRPVKLTPLYDQRAHTTLRPEFTPLYDQLAHTTLRPANSHHSMTSELTPLYNQLAHTTLRPASSHHSTNSELTPLYDQRAHTTL
ncbi:hypothetical protein EMCRGX_G011617 [Ephydatia muelleri]